MEQTYNSGKNQEDFCCIQVVGFDYYYLMRLIANSTLCCFYSLLVWLKHFRWGGKSKTHKQLKTNKKSIMTFLSIFLKGVQACFSNCISCLTNYAISAIGIFFFFF